MNELYRSEPQGEDPIPDDDDNPQPENPNENKKIPLTVDDELTKCKQENLGKDNIINKLKRKATEDEEQKTTLTNDLNTCRKSKEALETKGTQNQQLIAENRQLKETNEEQERLIKELQAKNKKQEGKINELEANIETLGRTVRDCKESDHEGVVEKNNKLNERLTNVEREKQILQDRLDKIDQEKGYIDKDMEKTLTKNIASLKEEIQQLKNKKPNCNSIQELLKQERDKNLALAKQIDRSKSKLKSK